MRNTLFTCSICKDIFRNRNDLNNHSRRDHQSMVKVKFQNGVVMDVKKGADGTFKCTCGKSVKLPSSLQRHAKRCNNELIESEDADEEEILMNVDDSDASEFIDMNDRVMPIDCIGTRISHKKADCR